MGAHDYVIRPVDKNELLARVRTQIRRKRFQERLRSSYEMSLSMALTDSLTGLYNRRYFDVHVQKLLQKHQTSRKSLGILMIDIDNFKSVNDTYGHAVGDEILKEFSERLQDKLRGFDMVARLGGEEFVAVLPDVNERMAHVVAERLRKAIYDKPFTCKVPEGSLDITTSVGGTLIDKGVVAEADDVMKQADDALYAAKQGGRNVTFFHEKGKLDAEEFIQDSRIFID
jgi:two-component system cell cycle response regulator